MNDPSPTDPTPDPAPVDPVADPTPDPVDPSTLPDWARKALEKANREAAAARTKLKEATDAAERAKLTDEERRKAELTDAQNGKTAAETRAQAVALELAVEREARKAGLADEAGEAAFRLLDASAVEFDENGKPQNVGELLKGLTEKYPFLKSAAAPPATGGTGSNPARPRQGGELTQKDLKTMTAEQIAELQTRDPQAFRDAMKRI